MTTNTITEAMLSQEINPDSLVQFCEKHTRMDTITRDMLSQEINPNSLVQFCEKHTRMDTITRDMLSQEINPNSLVQFNEKHVHVPSDVSFVQFNEKLVAIPSGVENHQQTEQELQELQELGRTHLNILAMAINHVRPSGGINSFGVRMPKGAEEAINAGLVEIDHTAPPYSSAWEAAQRNPILILTSLGYRTAQALGWECQCDSCHSDREGQRMYNALAETQAEYYQDIYDELAEIQRAEKALADHHPG